MTDMATTPCSPFLNAGQHTAPRASADQRPNGAGGPNPAKGRSAPGGVITSSGPQKNPIALASSSDVPVASMARYAAAIVDASPPRW